MSTTVLTATYQHLPKLRSDLAALDLGKHRPSWPNTVAVALLLADRYRDSRGYTDETVGQISAALVLSDGVVRDVLAALNAAGFWVKEAKGNQHRGTRRRPGFTSEHRGADPAEQDDKSNAGHPAEHDGEHRGTNAGASRDTDPSIAGSPPQHRGADPATPLVPPVVPPTTSSSPDLRRQIRSHLAAHTTFDPFLKIDDPKAVAHAEFPNACDIADEAIEFGDDPLDALEVVYPTRPPDDAGEFDPGLWTQEVV